MDPIEGGAGVGASSACELSELVCSSLELSTADMMDKIEGGAVGSVARCIDSVEMCSLHRSDFVISTQPFRIFAAATVSLAEVAGKLLSEPICGSSEDCIGCECFSVRFSARLRLAAATAAFCFAASYHTQQAWRCGKSVSVASRLATGQGLGSAVGSGGSG